MLMVVNTTIDYMGESGKLLRRGGKEGINNNENKSR